MQLADYHDQWISIRENGVSRKLLSQLARQVALSFLHQYYENGHYGKDLIDLLSEMATFSPDPEQNIPACSSLFGIIVEELCDDYEEFQFETYARVMSQVISYCRDLPQGKKLDRYLNGFRLYTEKDIHDRAIIVHTRNYTFDTGKKPKKICILSRVTIGSDVAIVSVIVQRLHRLFPCADIVILGSTKLQEIFGGNPHVRIREVNYSRHGGLLERFSSWFQTLEVLEEEIPPEGPDSMLIIDPDSRISQLGLLPLTRMDNHLFVNTHENEPFFGLSMAELTNEWINRAFISTDFCYPKVWVRPSALEQARNLMASLRQSGCRRITAINFGVGGNERKRLGIAFEQDLVCELLKEPGTVVLLDKGFGEEEMAGSRKIVNRVRSRGYSAIETRFGCSEGLNINHGIYNVEAGIGEMAALIAESDDYIGYDSACQHIAAALAVPTITVFAGTDNPAFVRRWSACGKTSCEIVHIESSDDLKPSDTNEIINRIMHLRAKHDLRPRPHRNLS
jgi:ADP-heptose:LPS heptosyltransferase